MNDNKIIFTLAIGIIFLFGVFMMLTGGEEEDTSLAINEQPIQIPEPVPVTPAPQPEPEPIPEPEVVAEPVLVVEEEPVIIPEPLVVVEEEVAPEPAEPPLPDLNESDPFVLTALSEVDGGSSVLMHLVSEELIRKFVVMVENISRGEFPDRNLPVNGPQEAMQVTELGSEFYLMDAASYRRFDVLVSAFANIDTETAVNFYQHLQPLLRRAYAELGIPNSNFDDVLISAIDNVLNARTAPQPQQLIRPSLSYEYADPEIENYSDVEKLLMRLGPDNTETLQRRLEFFKRRLQLGFL